MGPQDREASLSVALVDTESANPQKQQNRKEKHNERKEQEN